MEKERTQFNICLRTNELATRRHGAATGLVRAALAMPLACSPEHMISVGVASPGLVEFEHQEAARRIREMEEKLKREREVTRFKTD